MKDESQRACDGSLPSESPAPISTPDPGREAWCVALAKDAAAARHREWMRRIDALCAANTIASATAPIPLPRRSPQPPRSFTVIDLELGRGAPRLILRGGTAPAAHSWRDRDRERNRAQDRAAWREGRLADDAQDMTHKG